MFVRRVSMPIIAGFLLAALHAQAEAENLITFDNRSGQPALVKLIGPISQQIAVPTGRTRTVTVPPGTYHIKTRYGRPGRYQYSKGDAFAVEQTTTTRKHITITLHEVVNGNYDKIPITEAEFSGARTSTGRAPSPRATTRHGVKIIGPSAAVAELESTPSRFEASDSDPQDWPPRTPLPKSDHQPGNISVGDAKERVIAVLGKPRGSSGSPENESLLYGNGWVDVTNGVVSSVHLRQPVSRQQMERERQQAERERLELQRELAARRAANARSNTSSDGVVIVGVESSPRAPQPRPAGESGEPFDDIVSDPIELTDEWVAKTLRSSFGYENEVVDLTILSQRRPGRQVVCTFTADLRPRYATSIPGASSYSGPVKGTFTLTPRGNAVGFAMEYKSTVGKMKHTVTNNGTIKERWNR